MGEHHSAVHPRVRDGHLAGQHRDQQRRSRSSRWVACHRSRPAGCPRSPSRRSTSGSTTPGYVVANTKQPEIDYQLTNGTNDETHYKGDGGVQLSNFFNQAMFAVRFSDFNLLISNQITDPVTADVRPRRAGPGVQGRSVPEPRLRPLSRAARRADRLGPGRVHHHRQLSLRAERRHQRAVERQRAQSRTSTTCATR